MGYTVSHTIETDVDTFWRLFFDQELARSMVRKLGDLASFEVVEERTDAHGVRHRRIECRSNVELPAVFTKLVGDGSYTEYGRYDTTAKKYTAQSVPKIGAEKFGTRFEITTRPLGDGTHCERVIEVENTVKVFGIGGMIERFLERAQRDAHAQSAALLNEWLREQ